MIYCKYWLHCVPYESNVIFNVWFQPILQSFGQLSLRKERERSTTDAEKPFIVHWTTQLLYRKHGSYNGWKMCCIRQWSPIFLPSGTFVQRFIQNFWFLFYRTQYKWFEKHDIKLHIKLYIKILLGRKTRLQLSDCVSVRRTIMDVRDS